MMILKLTPTHFAQGQLGKLTIHCPSCTVDPFFAQEVAITKSLQEEKAKFAALLLEVSVITIIFNSNITIITFIISIITISTINIIVASESLHLAFQSVKFWIALETHRIFWPSGIFQDNIAHCFLYFGHLDDFKMISNVAFKSMH